MKKRVLSGIRATGRLHLGNYLGAVKGMVELQNNADYQTIYMVADVHTITTPYDREELRQNRREIILDYLAAGLDPEKSILFQQAEVGEHLELAFYFSSLATVARMQHLPTFKDKVKQYPENVNMALLNYPVLMAADILIYKAALVPVGIDQEPHLEIAREIARKFNSVYGTDFPEPRRFATQGEYVPSLTGQGKMSKSVPGSYIGMMDDLEMIRRALASAPTDSGQGDKVPSEGGVANLLKLVELFQGEAAKKQYQDAYLGSGLRYKDLKEDLAQAISVDLAPFQEKRAEIAANGQYLRKVITEGAKKAREIAKDTLTEVKGAMGLA